MHPRRNTDGRTEQNIILARCVQVLWYLLAVLVSPLMALMSDETCERLLERATLRSKEPDDAADE